MEEEERANPSNGRPRPRRALKAQIAHLGLQRRRREQAGRADQHPGRQRIRRQGSGRFQQDVSPLESQRSWEKPGGRQHLSRALKKAVCWRPPGPVDEVLNTVVNNLIVSAGLNVDAHCRVLLTTPIETFTIGHTIVISRGLIDVLPDEASLALVLAAELSHIALGHPTPTQFAFHNQTMLSDAELLQRFHFERSAQEMDDAGKKTIEIMRASPYQKTANAGLFLKALARAGPALAAAAGRQSRQSGREPRCAQPPCRIRRLGAGARRE